MSVLTDGVVAFLAAVGLTALLWLLADALLRRGVDENTVHRIFWDNALEVFGTCSM